MQKKSTNDFIPFSVKEGSQCHSSDVEENKSIKSGEVELVWIFSIICSVFVYLLFAFFISYFYHPDIELLKAKGAKLLIDGNSVRPKPVEAMLFHVAIIVIPVCLLGFYNLFTRTRLLKIISKQPVPRLICTICVLLIAGLIYNDFKANNPFGAGGDDLPQIGRDFRGGSNFDFYFGDLFLGKYLSLYLFGIIPLISCLFFIGIKKYHWDNLKVFKLTTNIAGYILVISVIISCVLMSTFDFPYQSENKYDLGAVYYSMTQVYGGVPLLVHGFTNTYGLYPQFLNPLFQISGLNVFNFSLVMSLILGLTFLLNFYCLKQYVSNKIILFSGMFTLIFFPFLDFKFTENFDANYALHVIRYIIPSALFFFITIYLKKKSKFVYWVTMVTMAFFVLWNPEFGIVTYIAWLMFNSYIDFYSKDGKPAFKKIAWHWLTGIIILISAMYLYKVTIYLIYGFFPDMSALWTTTLVFADMGYNLLPMKLVHPWNISALILMLGFVYAFSHWNKKEITIKAAVIFFLSVIGVGIFFYFEGRSHNWNFAMSSGMVIILLTILGDNLWTYVVEKNNFSLNILFIIFLCIISFSFFEIITNTGKLYELVTQENDKINDANEQQVIENCKEFILNNSQPKQKIYALTLRKFQDLLFDGSKRVSAFNPGMIDLCFNSDITRLENQILDSSFSVFITPYTFTNLVFMERPLAAIAATYEFRNTNMNMTLANKRQTRIPGNIFFRNDSELLFHRKYYDDRASAKQRIEDAGGIDIKAFSPAFSVEILYNSVNQVFPLATLIGNSDTAGFIFSTNTAKGLFAINGKGFILPIPKNGWLYCVMNIYPDHFEIYENGNRIYNHPLSKPLINSKDKLCIGNMGYMHYYVGAIAEVGITTEPLDSLQINKTWNEIKPVFSKAQ